MGKKSDALRDAIAETGILVPYNLTEKGGRLDLLCKEIPGQSKAWMRLVKELLENAASVAMNLQIGKRFLLKNGDLAFGWSIQLEAKSVKDLASSIEFLLPLIREAQPDTGAPAGFNPQAVTAPQVTRPPTTPNPLHGTTAHSRAPMFSGPDPVPPPGVVPSLKVIKREIDEEGKRVEVTEMPLPHVYEDKNVPNENGRGAFASTGNYHPRSTRKQS